MGKLGIDCQMREADAVMLVSNYNLKLGESRRFDQAQIKFMVNNTIFAIINTFEWRMVLFWQLVVRSPL